MDLVNKSFTTHRIKVVAQHTLPPPAILSQRLRDYLVGDTVRGVEIAADSSTLLGSEAGVLTAVDWQVGIDSSSDSGSNPDSQTDHTTHRIELAYEKSTYLAYIILSRNLLLLHAPAPIRNAVIRFLSQTFDTRISPLIPDSGTLIAIFETWLEDATSSARDVVVSLGFGEKAAGGGLRSLDIAIPPEDVGGFVGSGGRGGKFSDGLSKYVDKHIALNINDPEVRISRIACGGFVLGEGKVKVLEEGAAAVVLEGINPRS